MIKSKFLSDLHGWKMTFLSILPHICIGLISNKCYIAVNIAAGHLHPLKFVSWAEREPCHARVKMSHVKISHGFWMNEWRNVNNGILIMLGMVASDLWWWNMINRNWHERENCIGMKAAESRIRECLFCQVFGPRQEIQPSSLHWRISKIPGTHWIDLDSV